MKILVLLENLVLNPNADYAVIESSMNKIHKWLDAGAEVEYLTSISKFLELKKIDDRFHDLDLPDAKVHKKQETEKYKEVLASVSPQVFIDLKGSLDGEKNISSQLDSSKNVVDIVLKEVSEISKLPDFPEELKDYLEETTVVEEVE
ncbi:MAG: hypothetical protein UT02_C0018G0007 [Parcubacteria group bacterium GW2011_GWC2_38_7]|nr:MAG: hypothetical protein UT02_C0018G0007 [Parcubacteria group bacterium GW2011_GWC2_38_7]